MERAQRFSHASICLLSIQWPFQLPSRVFLAGLSTVGSGGRDAPPSVVYHFHTIDICRPLGVQSALGTFQLCYAHFSVCRSWLPVLPHWTFGQICCFELCPSVYIYSVWSTYWTPTSPLPPSAHPRSVSLNLRPRGLSACTQCRLGLLVR